MEAADGGLSLQMAGARVYTAALGPASAVGRWTSNVLETAASAQLWPAAFDVMTGRVRCVQDLVWDLHGSVS